MADGNYLVSDALQERFRLFIEDVDTLRASRNLRKVFFDYLKFQDGMSDKNFDKMLADVEAVFDLLDAIDDEKSGRSRPA